MPLPPHLEHLVNSSLEIERARQAVDDEARNYATHHNYTTDANAVSLDALMKAGRRGVAILSTDDGGFDVVPIGDTEAVVREVPPGNPKSWEENYKQISGQNWEDIKAENKAAKPPGGSPSPVHQEGPRPTSDAARGSMTPAKLQALHEDHRQGRHGERPSPVHQATGDALMLRKEEARADARQDAIERNKRRTKEELAHMAKYAADAKAAGQRMG